MLEKMARDFGNRKGITLMKSDVDNHNRLREAVLHVFKANGKAFGLKTPARFPRALNWPILSETEQGNLKFRDPSVMENEAGWKLFKYSDFLYKWAVKQLNAFELAYGYTYDISEVLKNIKTIYHPTIYFDEAGHHRLSNTTHEHLDALIWLLRTMSAKAVERGVE